MPRRARHLIPAQLPRRGEAMATCAVLVLLGHLLLAQLTFVLAVVFAAVSKTTRWRLWWLAAPAAAGLAWTLAMGPRAAAAGFAAGPAQILGYLTGGHPAGRLLHSHGAFAGVAGWLPRQFPLALIAAAAEATLAGWLDWVHTDEWAVRPPRPGALAAARGVLAGRATRAGAVVTRDGCVLGVAPDSGARVVLGWQEAAGGILVTGADARTLAVSSLQVVHAALRRRKPLLALDLAGAGGLAGVLGGACAATGTPLRAAGEAQAQHWVRGEPGGSALARVVTERSAALLSLRAPGAAVQVCAGIVALGEDLRRIGADGDGLVWLYGYEPPQDGPLSETIASLVAGGPAAGLPVLVTSTSPRAVADLAGLVSVIFVHRVADAATADTLAARTGTKLIPASLSAGGSPAAVPPVPGLVPAPAVPARTLLTLGPAEFVLAVSSPRYRLVKLGRTVPARLPRGAVL
jgi:hypothetical protein